MEEGERLESSGEEELSDDELYSDIDEDLTDEQNMILEAFGMVENETHVKKEPEVEEEIKKPKELSNGPKFAHPRYLGIQVVKKNSILRSRHGSFFLFSKMLNDEEPSRRIYVCSNRQKFSCPVEIEERVLDGFCVCRNSHTCPLKPIAISYVDPLGPDHPLDHAFRLDYRQRSDLPILKSTKDIKVLIGPNKDRTEVLYLKYFLTWNIFHYYRLAVLPHKCSTMTSIQFEPPKIYPVEITVHSTFKDEIILPIPIPQKRRLFEQSGLRDVWGSSYITIFEVYPSRGPMSGSRVVEIYFSMTSPTGNNFVPFSPGEIEGFRISPFLQIHSVRPMDNSKNRLQLQDVTERKKNRDQQRKEKKREPEIKDDDSDMSEDSDTETDSEEEDYSMLWPKYLHGKPQYVMVCTSVPTHQEGFVDLEIQTFPNRSLGGRIRNAYYFYNSTEKDKQGARKKRSSSSSSSSEEEEEDDDDNLDLSSSSSEDDDDDDRLPVVVRKKNKVGVSKVPLRRYSHRYQYYTSDVAPTSTDDEEFSMIFGDDDDDDDMEEFQDPKKTVKKRSIFQKYFRRNQMGMTPLHVSACRGDLKKFNEIYSSILKYTSYKSSKGIPPLHPFMQVDFFQNSPLHYAHIYEREEIIRYILSCEIYHNNENYQQKDETSWSQKVNYKDWTPSQFFKWEKRVKDLYVMLKDGLFDHIMGFMNKMDLVNLTISSKAFFLYYHQNERQEPSPANKVPSLIGPLPRSSQDLRRESIRTSLDFVSSLYPTHRTFHSDFECCQAMVKVVFVGELSQFQWNNDESRLYLLTLNYHHETKSFEITCSRLVVTDRNNEDPSSSRERYSNVSITSSKLLFYNRPLSTFETPKVVWSLVISKNVEFHWQREKKTIRITYDNKKMVGEFFFFSYVELRRFVVHIKSIVSLLGKYNENDKYLPIDKMSSSRLLDNLDTDEKLSQVVDEETFRNILTMRRNYPITFHQKLLFHEDLMKRNKNQRQRTMKKKKKKKKKKKNTLYEDEVDATESFKDNDNNKIIVKKVKNLLDPKTCDTAKYSIEIMKYILLPDNLETKYLFGDEVCEVQSMYDLIQNKVPKSSTSASGGTRIYRKRSKKNRFDIHKIEKYFKKDEYSGKKTLKDLKADFKKKYFDNEYQIHHPFKEFMYRSEYCERILDEIRLLQYKDWEVDLVERNRVCKIIKKLVYLERKRSNNNEEEENENEEDEEDEVVSFEEIENFLMVGKPYLWSKKECFFRILFFLLFSMDDIHIIEKMVHEQDDDEEEEEEEEEEMMMTMGPEYLFDRVILDEIKRRVGKKYGSESVDGVFRDAKNYRQLESVLLEMNENWMWKFEESLVSTSQKKLRRKRQRRMKMNNNKYKIRFECLSFEVYRVRKMHKLRRKILDVTERIKQIRFLGLQNTKTKKNMKKKKQKQEEEEEKEKERKSEKSENNKKSSKKFRFSTIFSPSEGFDAYHIEDIPKDFAMMGEKDEVQIFADSVENTDHPQKKKQQHKQEEEVVVSYDDEEVEERKTSRKRRVGRVVNPLDEKLRNFTYSQRHTTNPKIRDLFFSNQKKKEEQQQEEEKEEQQKEGEEELMKRKAKYLNEKAEELGMKYLKYLKKKLERWIERDPRSMKLLRLKFMLSKKRVQEMERFLRCKYKFFLERNVGIGLDTKTLLQLCYSNSPNDDMVRKWVRKEEEKERREKVDDEEEEEEGEEEEEDTEEESEEVRRSERRDRKLRLVVTMMNQVSFVWSSQESLVEIGPAESVLGGSDGGRGLGRDPKVNVLSQSIPISLLECQSPICVTWEELSNKLNQIVVRIMEWNAHFLYQPIKKAYQPTFRDSLSAFGIGPRGKKVVINNNQHYHTKKTNKTTKRKTELDFCEDILRTMNFSGYHQSVYGYLQQAFVLSRELTNSNKRGVKKWTEQSTRKLVFFNVEKSFYKAVPEAFLSLGHEKHVNQVEFSTHSELDEFVMHCFRKIPQFETVFPDIFALLKGFDRAFWMNYFHYCCSPFSLSIRNSQKRMMGIHSNIGGEVSESDNLPIRLDVGYYEKKYGRYSRGCPFNIRFRKPKDFMYVSRKLRIPNRPPKLGRVHKAYPEERKKKKKVLRYSSFF